MLRKIRNEAIEWTAYILCETFFRLDTWTDKHAGWDDKRNRYKPTWAHALWFVGSKCFYEPGCRLYGLVPGAFIEDEQEGQT
jgi:hypothetical protein